MNYSKFNVIGIDLGGTRLKAALVSPNGSLKGEINEVSQVHSDYETMLNQLLEVIHTLTRLSKIPIKAIGIGVAGLLDKERRRIIASPNCSALLKGPLVSDIEFKTGLPVIIDNDANMFAIGEGFIGAARGSLHYIAITLGTGVGGAIISNGEIVRGIDGGGGEIGHIPIAIRGPICGCGSRACLESFIGQNGVKRYIAKKHPSFYNLGLKKLSLMALKGNSDAIDVFCYIGKILGIGLSGLINIFNPEVIVIGGGVSASGPFIFETALKEIKKRAFKVYQTNLQLKPSLLGNMAGVIGAGRSAIISL